MGFVLDTSALIALGRARSAGRAQDLPLDDEVVLPAVEGFWPDTISSDQYRRHVGSRPTGWNGPACAGCRASPSAPGAVMAEAAPKRL